MTPDTPRTENKPLQHTAPSFFALHWRWCVMAAAVAVALTSALPFASGWNDGSRLATVESLVDRGSWTIDDSIFVKPSAASWPYHPRNPFVASGTLDKLWIGGHWFSDKSPAPALWLALCYWILNLLVGVNAHDHPGVFCYLMTLALSGLAYVVAVAATLRMTGIVGLAPRLRILVTASFGLATLALIYARWTNNHLPMLAVTALLTVQLAHLSQQGSVLRWAMVGFLASVGYCLDLGAGPPLVLALAGLAGWHILVGRKKLSRPGEPGASATGGSTRSQRVPPVANAPGSPSPGIISGVVASPRHRLGCVIAFFAAAFPLFALHHVLNYQIGGTFTPANASAAYVQWPGSPFDNMTGGWRHPSIFAFVVYAFDLLVGRFGFFLNNLPLLLVPMAAVVVLRRRPAQTPMLIALAAGCCGIWLTYAIGSTNLGGGGVSIRWFLPMIAPAFFLIAVALRECDFSRDLLILSIGGFLLMAIGWSQTLWIGRMIPGFWVILIATLLAWAGSHLRSLKPRGEVLRTPGI